MTIAIKFEQNLACMTVWLKNFIIRRESFDFFYFVVL